MKYTALFFLCACSAALAAKVSLKAEPFTVRQTFQATVLPDAALPIAVDAKQWAAFTIAEIVPHGTLVKKDQMLVRFDDEEYLKKLRDARSAAAAGKLTQANAEAEFITAEKSLPTQLQIAKSKAEEAAEAWEYFQKVRRDADVRRANLLLKQTELRLDSEREELSQLERMYKADDLTENTEEIIMKRQRESVKAAEIGLDLAKLAHKRQMEVTMPREAVALERDAAVTAAAYAEQSQNLPRSLELKRIALEDARVGAKRTAENLARLQKEKGQFVIKAPADGHFYYGTIQDGRWSPGDPAKAPAVLAPVGTRRPFAVIVPATATMMLEAAVDEASARSLKPGLAGFASYTGRADISFAVKVEAVSATPGIDGRYRVTLSAQYPAEIQPVAGMTASVNVIAYHKDAALTVPAKALNATNDGGWEVEIEETDGKTKRVPVKRGMTFGDKVEVLSGLAAEQSIIVPGA
jgi:HlyD family secretion protein